MGRDSFARATSQHLMFSARSRAAIVGVLTSGMAVAVLLWFEPVRAQYSDEGDVSLRVDADSARNDRFQYRLRFSPRVQISDRWSVDAFIATGDEFTSANSTIDDNDDEIHVRHLFARYEMSAGKLEFGVIPPYKGRVSSTGLSKEGWIKGLRGVIAVPRGRLELVAGELNDLRSSRALQLPDEVDYVEVEYSAELSDVWSYELAVEQLLDDVFFRGEVRYRIDDNKVVALETVRNRDRGEHRWVISIERPLPVLGKHVELFSFYTYAPARVWATCGAYRRLPRLRARFFDGTEWRVWREQGSIVVRHAGILRGEDAGAAGCSVRLVRFFGIRFDQLRSIRAVPTSVRFGRLSRSR